jgi:hypothetical protein
MCNKMVICTFIGTYQTLYIMCNSGKIVVKCVPLYSGTSSVYNVPTTGCRPLGPTPPSFTRGKAGRNNMNEEITPPPSPLG